MGRIDDLLLLEKAGELPAHLQKDLDLLRSAGELPALQKEASTPTRIDVHYNTPQEKISSTTESITGSGLAGTVAGMATKAALPVAGQMAGRMIGAASPLPGGAMIGESIGGGLGEAANQIAGITEPSLTEIGVAMAAGPVTRTVFAGLRMAGSGFLKGFAGRTNVADVAADVTAKMMNPKTPADKLWDIASQLQGQAVPVARTAQVVDDILINESKALSTPVSQGIIETLKGIQPQLQGGAKLDIKALVDGTKDLRTAASAAYKASNHRLGKALSDVRGAMLDDAKASGFDVVAKAANATRKEMAVEKLGNILRTADPIKEMEKAMASKSDRFFKGAFSASEQTEIKKLMQRMSPTTMSGGAGILGRSILGMFGASAGGAPGAVAGWALPDIGAKILATSRGREFMGKMLTGGHLMDPAKNVEAMGQFIRAQTAEDASGASIAEAVRAALQSKDTTLEQ
jgi:hypothetical protein